MRLLIALLLSMSFAPVAWAQDPLLVEELPLFVDQPTSCGADVLNLAGAKAPSQDYELIPISDVVLVSQGTERTTTRPSERAADGSILAYGVTSLTETKCSRVTSRLYEFIDDQGLLQSREVTCSFSCTGGGACNLSGCTPGSNGNCTSFICRGGTSANPCVGTCSGSTSSGPPSNPENKG